MFTFLTCKHLCTLFYKELETKQKIKFYSFYIFLKSQGKADYILNIFWLVNRKN